VKIVSLLPSTTEILFAIGAGDDVVGVTFECDFPIEARSRQIVSTSALPEGLDAGQIDAVVRARMAAGDDIYHLDEGALRDLAPDLVVTQDLCAVCAVDVKTVDAALDHLGCDGVVLTINPMTLEEVLGSINTLGDATGRSEPARDLASTLRVRLSRVSGAVEGRPRPRVAMLEWTDPLFSAGHWVPDMVTAAGGLCVLGESGSRSESITPLLVATAEPDLIVVAPCGYGLSGATGLAASLMDQGCLPPGVAVWAVDADAAFVRPGPRLVDGIEALAAICHPSTLPDRSDLASFVGRTPPQHA
jgi:iron complex transport system substrate-binding protein